MSNMSEPAVCGQGKCRVDPARLQAVRRTGTPVVQNTDENGIMLFTKKDCPICCRASEIINEVLESHPGTAFAIHDLDTVEGLVEGSMRNTLEVPTILVLRNGQEKIRWEGRAPLAGELASMLKQ